MRRDGLILTCFLASMTASGASAAPKIHCDNPVHNFGTIWSHDSVKHGFVIKNVGDAPLEIKRIRKTCGCTIVEGKPQTIAPGASATIRAEIRGKTLRGKVSKAINVESNDPKTPVYRLTFTGEVKSLLSMNPRMARFSELDRTEPSTIEITITNNTDKPIRISEPVSTLPNVSATLTEVEKGKVFKVTITARPPYKGNFVHGKVTLKTDLPGHAQHMIPFFGRLPPAIEIRPKEARVMNLGKLEAGKEYSQTFRIVSMDDSAFQITEVSSNNWRVLPTIREIKPDREYEVRVQAHPPYEWGMNRAQLTFKTASPSAPSLSVQVYGELPPPIAMSSPSLNFRGLQPDRPAETSLTLTVNDASGADITAARSSVKNVAAQVETLQKGKQYKLTAKATPPISGRRLEGEVVLETTHPKMKTITVPIRSMTIPRAMPDVSIIPDPVVVIPPAKAGGQPISTRLIVRANRDAKVRVTRVETGRSDIKASIEPQKGLEDKMTFVRLTIPADATIPDQGVPITIHTDHPKHPKVVRRIARAGSLGARVLSRGRGGAVGSRLRSIRGGSR